MTALLVALGAAVGAPLRFLIASLLDDRLPWGTLLVNVAGSAALGALIGADPSESTLALIGTGLCGAFTTYSGFALQAHDLGSRRGAAYAVVTLAACVAAAAVGHALMA